MSDTPRDDQNTPTADSEHVRQSAADRAHGTHGKGDSRESLHDTPNSSAADGAADGATPERRSEPRGKQKKKWW